MTEVSGGTEVLDKKVKFFINGGFGNNLFQYFAAQIIKKIYNYKETEPTQIINLEFNTVITDEIFTKIINEYINGNIYPIDTSKDILMMGYFQRSEIFLKEREFLRSLFNKENNDYISNRIRISNILNYKTKHEVKPDENDLTLHIRLRDFYDKDRNTSQIYDPDYLKNIIKQIKYDKLYIVSDKVNEEWEKKYIEEFNEFNPIIISGLLGDDFDFLLNSKKLITSASTMCWLAAFLGTAKEVHIPYNSYYGGYESGLQSLAEFSSDCKVYYDTEYWKPV
jgi:hypothetical protein